MSNSLMSIRRFVLLIFVGIVVLFIGVLIGVSLQQRKDDQPAKQDKLKADQPGKRDMVSPGAAVNKAPAQEPAELSVFTKALALTTDGRFVAVINYWHGNDKPARHFLQVWNLETGKLVAKLDGHAGEIRRAHFSQDGRFLSAVCEKAIFVWDVATGKLSKTYKGERDNFLSCGFTSDGNSLVAGTDSGHIYLWNPNVDGKPKVIDSYSFRHHIPRAGIHMNIRDLSFSSDGCKVVSVDSGSAIVWDVKESKALTYLELDDKSRITFISADGRWGAFVSISPDGHWIAAPVSRREPDQSFVQIWDAKSGRALFSFGGPTAEARVVTFSPDGKRMAFAGKDRKVHLWDVQTRQLLQQFAEHSHEINLLTFSTDGKKLISGSLPTGFPSPNALRNKSELHDFPTIKFIEIKSWDLSGELQPKGKPAERMPIRVAPPGQFASVVVSPNLEQLLVIPGKNDVFLRLDPKAHEREIQEGLEIDRFQSPKGLTIWPLKVGQSKVFILLGKEDPLFPALNSERYSLLPTFSPDGSCLVCDGMFWDARTGNKLLNIDAGIEDEMVFNPEGNLLSTISHHHRLGYGVIIWQARTGTKLLMDLEKRNYFDAKGSIQVRFSPDGKQFVSASRRKRAKDTVTGIKVWSTRTWEEASRFTINSSIRDLGLNPSGSRLLGLCGAEKLAEVKSWDSSTGKELATLCKATSLRFSSDGRYCVTIASPANDQTEITIWDTDSAIKIATLPNMNNRTSVWHLSPDGKTLATSAMDHAISIWNTQTGQELLTLPKQPNPIRCVVFDSSGRSLLTVLDNGTVKRWDVKTGKEADW